ncbi:MAG: hypothetical protein ACTSPJ_10615, partial [Candidatus Heimdallarchaeaceae archaeon]
LFFQLIFFILNSFRKQSIMNFIGLISKSVGMLSGTQLIPFFITFFLLTIASFSSSPILVILLSWILAGSHITSDDKKTKTNNFDTQLNRLKGLIKVYGEIEIDKASEIMGMEKTELITFLVENVGAGTLDLTIVDDKIVTPVNADINGVLKSLDTAFKNWFDTEKTKSNKKK